MSLAETFALLHQRLLKYDLLSHPFYKAWSAGDLQREELREYAQDYYHHVEAFPMYLSEFAMRLDDGRLRRAVIANMQEELGSQRSGEQARSHAELWLDFAEGMGANRDRRGHEPVGEICELIELFHEVAMHGEPEEALIAFYAYESQVPRIAKEKERGLRELYGADERTSGYFSLHAVADVYHARVWREELSVLLKANPPASSRMLARGEATARALWRALDGIEAKRQARKISLN